MTVAPQETPTFNLNISTGSSAQVELCIRSQAVLIGSDLELGTSSIVSSPDTIHVHVHVQGHVQGLQSSGIIAMFSERDEYFYLRNIDESLPVLHDGHINTCVETTLIDGDQITYDDFLHIYNSGSL